MSERANALPRAARLAVIAAMAMLAPAARAQVPAVASTGTGAGASASAGVAVQAATATATATATASASGAAATPSKKDLYLAAKGAAAVAERKRRAAAEVAARPGKPPPPVISLFNTWTHEWLVLERDPRAPLPPPAEVDRFLRCHFTNQTTDMRQELVAALRDAATHFAARRVDIVSGYRSPKYNLMLRKKGHEVAKDSQHTLGHAVDFRIPGVDVRALDSWALARRMGGVGLYLESQFVHMDVGPIRRWNGT
ncbi:MAG TPA: DUF882 domain-containing protein [Kofleriaceae bacterium]|nr:DUF882 domain-containing protein [Kofleriaceae bacterium]